MQEHFLSLRTDWQAELWMIGLGTPCSGAGSRHCLSASLSSAVWGLGAMCCDSAGLAFPGACPDMMLWLCNARKSGWQMQSKSAQEWLSRKNHAFSCLHPPPRLTVRALSYPHSARSSYGYVYLRPQALASGSRGAAHAWTSSEEYARPLAVLAFLGLTQEGALLRRSAKGRAEKLNKMFQ